MARDRPVAATDRGRRRHAARANVERARADGRASLDRIAFLGRAADDELDRALRRRAGGALSPCDEDFGYVTLEAFLARKAGDHLLDSGGPTEFVVDGIERIRLRADAKRWRHAINQRRTERPRRRCDG